MRNIRPTRYVIQKSRNLSSVVQSKHVEDKTGQTTSPLSEFGERTTLHGLRYTVQQDISAIRRLIWIVALLTFVGMLIYQIVDRVTYYYAMPINVNVRVNYNASLLFPTVTICNQNAFKATLASRFNIYHLLEKMYSASANVTVEDLQKYGVANTSLDDIFNLTAHDKEDFITKCFWKGKECGPDDFDLVATDHGICYSFNNREGDKSISSVGSENGLRMTLNVEQYEYMSGPRDSVGVKILFHTREEVPRVHALGHAVTTGAHTFIGLKMVHVRNLPPPYGTCSNRSLEYTSHYTLAGCQMDCLTLLAYDKCHCRHTYMLHKNGVPPICTLYQYITCLKPLLEGLLSMPQLCNCPVSCEFRSFENDMSYGSTSKYAIKQFVNENNFEKLSTAQLAAKEVTSRMQTATWQRTVALAYDFIQNFDDVEEVLLVSLSRRVDELINAFDDHFVAIKYIYNTQTFLYNMQIYLVRKNFIGAKDDMEEQTIQAVVIAYVNFIMKIEKNVGLLTDKNRTDPSLRLMLHSCTSLMVANRIEMIRRTYVNYTTLKRAYETGTPILNHSFVNLSTEWNEPATPKYLLMDSLIHNDYARIYKKLLFLNLNNLTSVLKNIISLADKAYATGFVDNDDLLYQRQQFEYFMRKFVFARSVFYYETVNYPIRKLETRRENLHTLWHHITEEITTVKQRLQAMQAHLHKIKDEFLHAIANIKTKLENYIYFQNETFLSISDYLTSQRVKTFIYCFNNFFEHLNENEKSLVDWIKLVEKELIELWHTVIGDRDSSQFHNYRNGYQFIRNFSDVKAEIIANFTNIIRLCQFSTIVSSKGHSFINSLARIRDEAMVYTDSAAIDNEFARNNFLQIDIFYEQMSYEEVQQQIGYDIFALLCDVGGSMGLLLGASALSVLEIIDVLFTQTFFKIRAIF
ncbi:uncharacterized protein LOC132560265 [Ylistrum balloti]|uniref:uncharacterized protein LOC132560265 n=1 Tax=Ylistrum balloti TaxID=509963 RepID=UPI002905E935|nr:uncharacterized protein LOC132560265 [Ylistrum balloti]